MGLFIGSDEGGEGQSRFLPPPPPLIMRTITLPVSFACMCQACVHLLVHAYQYYGLGIDNRSIV